MENTNKRFWNKFAKLYAPFMSKNAGTYDAICAKLSPYVNEQKSVLELACGTGQISFRMAQKARSWEATDYAENMIAQAKKAHEQTECKNLTFCTADATALPYEDSRFDVAVIANALHIMPEPDAALQEISRVLKNGGILFAPTFVYEKGYSKWLIWFMEKLGFQTFHKWTAAEFASYTAHRGFDILETSLIKGKPLFECVLVGQKKTEALSNA